MFQKQFSCSKRNALQRNVESVRYRVTAHVIEGFEPMFKKHAAKRKLESPVRMN